MHERGCSRRKHHNLRWFLLLRGLWGFDVVLFRGENIDSVELAKDQRVSFEVRPVLEHHLDQVLVLEGLVDVLERHPARRAHLLLLEPVREAARAIQVLAGRQEHRLVEYLAADAALELLNQFFDESISRWRCLLLRHGWRRLDFFTFLLCLGTFGRNRVPDELLLFLLL